MIELFLMNWKLVVMSVMSVVIIMLWTLYRDEEAEFQKFKATMEAQGRLAIEQKQQIEAHHAQVLQEVAHGFNDALPRVRDEAVANYIARHGGGTVQPVAGCLLYNPSSGVVSKSSGSTQVPDAATGQCVPDREFIRACAEDALRVIAWQEWANKNELPVE